MMPLRAFHEPFRKHCSYCFCKWVMIGPSIDSQTIGPMAGVQG
jgi:hypothetical protein